MEFSYSIKKITKINFVIIFGKFITIVFVDHQNVVQQFHKQIYILMLITSKEKWKRRTKTFYAIQVDKHILIIPNVSHIIILISMNKTYMYLTKLLIHTDDNQLNAMYKKN